MSARPSKQPRRAFNVRRITAETPVRRVEYHRSIGSTNSRALALAADAELPLPALVLAENQTEGRGRGVHGWWSGPGAIACSLVLPLQGQCAPHAWPQIALAAAVGVCEALESLAPAARFTVRWPNDVCWQGLKICGILPELSTSTPPRLVLGIGVNVNNSLRGAPSPLPEIAVGLCDIVRKNTNLTSALVALLQAVSERLDDLAGPQSNQPAAWSERCALRGRLVRLRVGRREIDGRCAGIDASGALVLVTSDGRERFYAGTIAALEDDVSLRA
jgi:BirA family biotin operon repressor/biotin-[acetyl-CoA-carboxylase] ligase